MVRLFTDGSASPQHGAGTWAACIVDDRGEHVLKGHAWRVTHHAMELEAILRGLEYIYAIYSPQQQVHVYTDSEYVVHLPARRSRLEANRFLTRRGAPVKNLSRVKKLLAWLDHHPVRLFRVESHKKTGYSESTDYNRKVDKLSRELLRQITREH